MIIEKVTAFITRFSGNNPELLLFQHPHAGIQIPSGTVNQDETPEEAVLREVKEETGLGKFSDSKYLGSQEECFPDNQKVVLESTKVHSRPDKTSFDWAYLRPGITVNLLFKKEGYTQILYEEFDQVANSEYVTLSIKGWVPSDTLTDKVRRHFFHLTNKEPTEDQWEIFADNHTFTLFWASFPDLPEIIPPQNSWLSHLEKGYKIKPNW